MAVTIRLKRIGKKNSPAYRVVVADARSPRDGRFLEEVGSYSPMKAGENFTLNLDRVNHWMHCGAKPSDTVASFIRKAKRAAKAAAAK